MAGEKNIPARRNPTGQELDRQYDELHQGAGPHGRQGRHTRVVLVARGPAQRDSRQCGE